MIQKHLNNSKKNLGLTVIYNWLLLVDIFIEDNMKLGLPMTK